MKKTLLLTTSLTALALSQSAIAGETGEKMVAPPIDHAPVACPWTLGADVLYLKAHSSEGEFDDQDNEFAYRLEAAYKSGDNLGIRARFFDFEGTDDDGALRPDIQTIDLEVFDNFELGSFQGEYAFGLRYLSYEEPHFSHHDVDFDGWGPTFALELVRPISGAFSVYANTRFSIIFGDDDEGGSDDDFTALITEVGLGLQYDFDDCGSNVRLGVEAQYYSGVHDSDSEDAALFGAVLGVNYKF